MSHTSTVEAIAFVDLDALRSAIQELKDRGLRLDLIENATPRAYFPDQEGLGEAPYVVKLHDTKYDIGLYPRENGQGYEARCDTWGGYISDILGAQATGKEGEAQSCMGKLFNVYAIHAATRAAVRQGYAVQRIDREDGSAKLVVNLAA